MGVPRASEALAMPSITCENCHMTSGFSGLPKLRQVVAARGRAPLAATLRAASATACIAPRCGLSWHQRPLPSVESARARLTSLVFGSLMRTTAASLAPGPASVFVRTEVSYCSVIQRLEASVRSEEHTSELQSHSDLVCRLLLEKKKNKSSESTKDRNTSNWRQQ